MEVKYLLQLESRSCIDKTTSETQYLETPIKSGSDCGSTPNNPVLIQTISECTANSTVSTVEIRNLSNEVKTFYLETNSNGTWALYDTITINPTSSITRTLTALQNQTIQWRALETSYAQWSLDSPYQVSNIETVNCTPVTTTTVPQPKYIFEPLISTNRVCDFDNGGAEFGITVDNSRSNVAAEVLKKFWINTTQIGEEVIKVPAGQKVDFSSIEVSENSFFNIYLEVTNTENGKVQEMIQSKDADCIEDERPIDREKNPIDKIVDEEDAPVMDEGDTDAMGDNGEDILFLPGDDYVEWVYEEDADDAFEPPIFTPGNTPTLPDTGFNFGRIILAFGAIMAAFGAFILRKSFRY